LVELIKCRRSLFGKLRLYQAYQQNDAHHDRYTARLQEVITYADAVIGDLESDM
jgi:hypothetical protein